jgi:hypothetical protein
MTPRRAPLRPPDDRKVVKSVAPPLGTEAVAGSAGSTPTIAFSRIAQSRTVRAIGPAVSWLAEIGMMPVRLTRPTVGLRPTSPFAVLGHTTEPSVSVPTPTIARLALMAAPVPELDPHGLRSST